MQFESSERPFFSAGAQSYAVRNNTDIVKTTANDFANMGPLLPSPAYNEKYPAEAPLPQESSGTRRFDGTPLSSHQSAGPLRGAAVGPSVVAGSLNAFLNGAYAGPPEAGRGGGGGSVRASSVMSGGVGGVGVDAPLRRLIETKEKELHEIHDFRIRYLRPFVSIPAQDATGLTRCFTSPHDMQIIVSHVAFF